MRAQREKEREARRGENREDSMMLSRRRRRRRGLERKKGQTDLVDVDEKGILSKNDLRYLGDSKTEAVVELARRDVGRLFDLGHGLGHCDGGCDKE